MKRACSQDIRELVFRKIALGMSQVAIAEELHISTRTIYNWKKIKKEEGRVKPIGYGERNKGKILSTRQIKDNEKFIKFIEENAFKTRKELARLWNEKYNENVSEYGIRTALESNDITFKKKLQNIKKQILLKEKNF